MTSPLTKLVVDDGEANEHLSLPLAKETIVESLLELTSKVLEVRLQLTCWGLVLRSL